MEIPFHLSECSCILDWRRSVRFPCYLFLIWLRKWFSARTMTERCCIICFHAFTLEHNPLHNLRYRPWSLYSLTSFWRTDSQIWPANPPIATHRPNANLKLYPFFRDCSTIISNNVGACHQRIWHNLWKRSHSFSFSRSEKSCCEVPFQRIPWQPTCDDHHFIPYMSATMPSSKTSGLEPAPTHPVACRDRPECGFFFSFSWWRPLPYDIHHAHFSWLAHILHSFGIIPLPTLCPNS